jgi:hypothetical protein
MAASQEDIEQIKVVEFVRQCTNLPFWHTANQRQTSPQHGALLKRLGVKPGVSDLFFPRGNNKHKGLFIELKTLTGKPSKLQEQFLSDMIAEDYAGKFAYGAEHAIQIIKTFYSI